MKMCHFNVKILYSCLSDHPIHVISGGECHEDDINELMKEDEVDGEEDTENQRDKERLRAFWPGDAALQGPEVMGSCYNH